LNDLGFAPQRRLFDKLTQIRRAPPPVITCHDVLENPKLALKALCDAIDISFSEQMLSWETGERPTDGAWAPYWYASVQSSTGFGKAPAETPRLSDSHLALVAECKTDYEHLLAHKISI